MTRDGAPDWTGDEKATLAKLWEQGLSTRAIGLAMGRSKSAVCGMARRIHLPFRPVGRRNGSKDTQPRAQRVHRGLGMFGLTEPRGPAHELAKGAAWQPLPGSTPVPLMDLKPGQCKWPIGDEKPFLFCGKPCGDGSYCKAHARASVGKGTWIEREAVALADEANQAEWRRGEKAQERKWEVA